MKATERNRSEQGEGQAAAAGLLRETPTIAPREANVFRRIFNFLGLVGVKATRTLHGYLDREARYIFSRARQTTRQRYHER